METNLGLVAGSHNNNEFIIIRQDGGFGVSSNKFLFIITIYHKYISEWYCCGLYDCRGERWKRTMVKHVNYVEKILMLMKMVRLLWLAMSVLFLFVEVVMNMNVGRDTKFVLNAKPDLSVSKVYYFSILVPTKCYESKYISWCAWHVF